MLPQLATSPLPASTLITGFFISLLPVSVALFVLLALLRLFKHYERGEVFGIECVKAIRHFGYALMVWVFACLLFTTLISATFSFANAPGERMIIAEFGLRDLSLLIVGIITVLIAQVMEEARKLNDEQSLTI